MVGCSKRTRFTRVTVQKWLMHTSTRTYTHTSTRTYTHTHEHTHVHTHAHTSVKLCVQYQNAIIAARSRNRV